MAECNLKRGKGRPEVKSGVIATHPVICSLLVGWAAIGRGLFWKGSGHLCPTRYAENQPLSSAAVAARLSSAAWHGCVDIPHRSDS